MTLFNNRTRRIFLLLLIGLALAGAFYLAVEQNAWQWLTGFIHEKTHPALLLMSFLVLPIAGFPISVLLILLGIRFGPVYGMVIMAIGFAVHLLVIFSLSHSYVRPWLSVMAARWNVTIPRLPNDRQVQFSVVFMAVPGLPYTMKNYLLAQADLPFMTYFLICWIVNGMLGAPFVILSGAVTRWAILLPVALLIVVTLSYLIGKLTTRRMNTLAAEENVDKTSRINESERSES